MVQYKVEFRLDNELISKELNKIALLLKENGFTIKDKQTLYLDDLKQEGLDIHSFL